MSRILLFNILYTEQKHPVEISLFLFINYIKYVRIVKTLENHFLYYFNNNVKYVFNIYAQKRSLTKGSALPARVSLYL